MMLEGWLQVPCSMLDIILPKSIVIDQNITHSKRALERIADLSSYCVPGSTENAISNDQVLMAKLKIEISCGGQNF